MASTSETESEWNTEASNDDENSPLTRTCETQTSVYTAIKTTQFWGRGISKYTQHYPKTRTLSTQTKMQKCLECEKNRRRR